MSLRWPLLATASSLRAMLLTWAIAASCVVPSYSQEAAAPESNASPSSEETRPKFSEAQLAKWLQRFPAADADGDGRLSSAEANAYRDRIRGGSGTPAQGTDRPARRAGRGAPRVFSVDPGWQEDRFPDHAICYRTPDEIIECYAATAQGRGKPVTRFEKPQDGSLRIVATGHSFMAPGFKTLPTIAKAAGFRSQGLFTHTGGGITGSARYKWEQENGIFQFEGNPTPKLLASIANADWDVMMWGPYFNDEPEYYSCWIEFCLRYHPDMTFYLSDAWPQLSQLKQRPTSEDELTAEKIAEMGRERFKSTAEMLGTLNKQFPDKVFVLPTSEAMVLAADYFHRGKLPGIQGVHKAIGHHERSLWRDTLGHLGPGFDRLEGYVFYATLYGRSPERIEAAIPLASDRGFPSDELDRAFRKIAWQAVLNNPLTGIRDEDADGVADETAEPPPTGH